MMGRYKPWNSTPEFQKCSFPSETVPCFLQTGQLKFMQGNLLLNFLQFFYPYLIPLQFTKYSGTDDIPFGKEGYIPAA